MNEGTTLTRLMLFSLANSHAAFSARSLPSAYHNLVQDKERILVYLVLSACLHYTSLIKDFMSKILCNENSLVFSFTWSFSHCSALDHEFSSSGSFGVLEGLDTAETEDVRTTFLSIGFFLHDRNTFNVPLTAGSRTSTCKMFDISQLIRSSRTICIL